MRSEWTIEDIEKAWEQVKKAAEKYGLEYYEPDIRIVTADQMLDAYSSHGLPNLYNHWSFGKSFIENERDYKRGRSGLAYEMIINSNPSIAYLMENNSLLMQYLTLAHACLHGDTEFLTPGGWKKISEYTEGDKVLQIDRKGNSSFVLPEKYHKYKGKLLDIHTARVSQRVTLNHRLPLIKPKKGLEIVTAEEFLENHNSKTRGSLWEFQRTFKAPNTLGLPFSDNELRLDVAIKADGSLYPRTDSGHPCCVSYNRVRFHLKKQRKIERLENLLNLLNMEYTKKPTYEGRVSITFNLDRKIEKTYSKSYYRASPSQLKIIVEEMQHWDGTSHNFSSQYKTDCDFIQYALAACGKGSTLNRGTRCWTVSFSDKKTASCNSHRKKYEFEMLPEQDVYCFTVPTGMFLIRDRNRITVTGNSIGHSAFFRMNYMFKDRTDADFIIPYLKFARKFIAQCEKEYGVEKVEKLLDACHALKWYGIHKYKKPKTKTAQQIKERERFRLETERLAYNKIFENTKKPKQTKKRSKPFGNRFDFPYDNILYFIEKNSPSLAPWEKEIVRITRTLSEYFYPQMSTKVLNEGFASFMHYHLVYDLFDEDIIDEGGLLEFLSSHCAVCCQYDYTKTTRLNPYTLGFKILMDVKRMCQKPDDEDKRLFPDIVNTDWLETIKDIVQNYRDESFIRQFLSPKVVKDLKLFEIVDDTDSSEIVIRSTQQDSDFKRLRNSLADQYVFSNWFPVVEVIGVAKSNFCLILKHFPQRGAQLDYDSEGYYQFVAALRSLWGHPIEIREAQRF